MLKIGITGGIGSGKSTVSKLLSSLYIPIFVADDESKRLINSSSEIKNQLITHIGNDIFQDGILNKALLASYIFTDDCKLALVNSIIHPQIIDAFEQWCKQKKTEYQLVAYEAAILFESGSDKVVDKIITITAPLDDRIKRVMKRDSTSKEKVMERINKQMSEDEKIKRSDFIIINDSKHSLIEQTVEILKKLDFII